MEANYADTPSDASGARITEWDQVVLIKQVTELGIRRRIDASLTAPARSPSREP
jgi:hypothetical protein